MDRYRDLPQSEHAIETNWFLETAKISTIKVKKDVRFITKAGFNLYLCLIPVLQIVMDSLMMINNFHLERESANAADIKGASL